MDHSIIFKGYEHRERPLTRGIIVATVSEVHQKLIVVDGCMAFKGSANATLDGWTRKGELIEFVNDPLDLRQLNRYYFAEFMARKRSG
jgi:phosphatidylserine/phosphatidylglycerophosphate/cardiolipin synthase-like enzyme